MHTAVRCRSTAVLQALHLYHLPKLSILPHPKFIVGALLEHTSLVEHVHAIGILHCREPVRDNHDRHLVEQNQLCSLKSVRAACGMKIISDCAGNGVTEYFQSAPMNRHQE